MPRLGTNGFAPTRRGPHAVAIMPVTDMPWPNDRARPHARAEGCGDRYTTSDDAMRHEDHELSAPAVAIVPVVAVIVVNVRLARVIRPATDTSYPAREEQGATSIRHRSGNRAIDGSRLPNFDTASEVGDDTAIAAQQAFSITRDDVSVRFPPTR